MKRLLTTVSLLVLLLVLPASVLAAPVAADNVSVVVGDVTYTVSTYEDGTAVIADIVVAETVTEPMDLVIPASFTIDGESYTVTGVNAIGQWKIAGGEESYDQYEKIKSVSFEADELPMIHGNLFGYKNETPIANIFPEAPFTYTIAASKEYPTIPGFVSNYYNHDGNGDGTNDTYYLGENLVRVDPAYEGDFAVKDGTVSILAGAFWGCSKLEDVTIPDSVEWIGINAFAHSSVTTVNIPQGLLDEGNRIEAWAFQSCENLTAVTFPEDTDKRIDVAYMAFAGCKSLTGFDFSHVNLIDTLSFAFAFAEGTEIDLGDASYTSSYTYEGNPATFFASGIGKVTLPSDAGAVPTWTFAKCQHLTEVVLPEVTNKVGTYAFENCTSLAADILADSKVTHINHRAFANTAMTEITIPDTVVNIEGGAFAGNEQLETINWKAGSMNSNLFPVLNDTNKGYTFPLQYSPARAISTWTECTPVKTLNVYAMPGNPYVFQGLEYLETVHFLCDVTMLQQSNFAFCPSLEAVTFSAPEKLTNIGGYAFNGCLNLKSFPFEQLVNLEEIGPYAFFLTPHKADNTMGLVNGTDYAALSDERKSWGLEGELDLSGLTKLTTINVSAFYNQYNITKLHLPANLVTYPGFGSGPFVGTASLEELVLEGSAPKDFLSSNFFTGEAGPNGTCFHTGLKSITVKGEIPENTLFYSMKNLETVNLPNATAIPAFAFMNCTALETVDAPKATSVGSHAFWNTGLKTVTLKKDVTYGANVFAKCSNLESVTAEEGVTSIPSGAFMDCPALKSVSAPDLTDIGSMAFANTGLKSVVIDKDVTYGANVFYGCSDLETVVVEEGVTELADFIFENTGALKSVSLPSTLELVRWGAFKNSGLEVIELPASVEEVDDDAFRGSVKQILVNGDVNFRRIHLGGTKLEQENLPYLRENAVMYYTNEEAEAAVTSVINNGLTGLKEIGVTAKKAADDMGTSISYPEKVLAGSDLALTVTYFGSELTADDYTCDYDKTDLALGERTVNVALNEAVLIAGRDPYAISATGFDGSDASGTAITIHDEDEFRVAITVLVVDHLECIFVKPSSEVAEAATCTSPAMYYAQCSFEGCTNIDKTAPLVSDGAVDPDNHTGKSEWVINGDTHAKVYKCCDAFEIEEAKHSGGTATCTDLAECEICEAPYGKKDPKNHTGKSEWVIGEDTHAKVYNCCDAFEIEETKHSGGTATCSELAECEICEAAYGKKDSKNHTGTSKWVVTDTKHSKVYQCCGGIDVAEAEHSYTDGVCVCGKQEEVKNEVIRLKGVDRFDTAIKAADQMKENLKVSSFDTIIVASGADYADALSGSYLAAVKKAPILLSYKEKQNNQVIEYIKANLAQGGKVYILGGTAAVSQQIDDAMASYGFDYERLAGENRFETNLKVLQEAGVKEGQEILVATGTNFADCLSASATGMPIMLTYKKMLPAQTDYLATLKGNSFCIIGGENAVSKATADAFAGYGNVTRLAGDNRYHTSVLVAQKYFPDATSAVLAYARNYPDGLCGGVLAATMDAPLVLTDSKYYSYAKDYAKNIRSGAVLGGDGLISDEAVRVILSMDASAPIIVK